MSLHRVSSMENWEHQRGSSPASFEYRRMSFNPVGDWKPPEVEGNGPRRKESAVAAMDVPEVKRILQVVLACVYCLLGSGMC
jgi:hypothetical protein